MKIDIDDLSFSFDGKKVLKNVSLLIEEGEFLALMGPNGSGKTTLLRCIMNYLRPNDGAVLVDSKPVYTMSERQIARLFAVVPQSSPTDFSFTAYEMVTMGRIPHARGKLSGETKEDAEVIKSAMERTNTWQFADRLFSSLSGGERQRVIIARALAQKPRVLLLDEPTVYLDITGQFEVMDLLTELNRDGLTVIAVLHDINLASRYCRKIALLNEGRLESYGSPSEVFTQENIVRIYDVDVLVRRDPITKSISVIPRTASAIRSSHGRRAHILCGGGTGGEILHELLDAGFSPSIGVVNVLDSDFELAREMHVPVVSEVPFAQVSEESHAENLKLVDESVIVIVADFPVGPGNLKNLEAAKRAMEKGKRIVVLSPGTIEERDFVGGRGKELIGELIRNGALSIETTADIRDILSEGKRK
ncbi:MAG: ABC transporter ATP-binding protein [Thermoplasmata archaeon]|nr:ABC transporter ATP-binding protein [Thermoplasmata archaeon]